jgi:hypothetical protein
MTPRVHHRDDNDRLGVVPVEDAVREALEARTPRIAK